MFVVYRIGEGLAVYKSKYNIEYYKEKSFHNWTVIDFSHQNEKGDTYWVCSCTCGRIQPVRASYIVREKSTACKFCRTQAGKGINSPHWKGGSFMCGEFYHNYRASAKRRNINFEVTISELEEQWNKQEGKCAYTGEILVLPDKSENLRKGNASIDRIDSSKGYVKGNIQFTTKHINIAKKELSDVDFINICKQVAKHRGGTCGV